MKNKFVVKILLLFILVFPLVSLNSCAFIGCEDFYFDENGYLVGVKNKNYFKFDDYNTLEITIDENEKIILYAKYDKCYYNYLVGKGEWIKDDVITPVYLYEETTANIFSYSLHGDIYIEVDTVYIDDVSLIGTEKDPINNYESTYVGILHNDYENPKFYRVTKQEVYEEDEDFNILSHSPAEFSKNPIKVQYKTYMTEGITEDAEEYVLLPKECMFYDADETTEFYSEEIGLSFNAVTGKGIWSINGKEHPVMVEFDKGNFLINVCHDTDDEFNGYVIFDGAGRKITETEAVYEIYQLPDNSYDDTLKYFTLKKRTK